MNVVFYTFNKRVNSTAQPSGGASYSCIIKSQSSVITPQISLVWPGSGNPTEYNYAYIADFQRYYWVRNWTYADRQWTADLQVDPLASWKYWIGRSNKYVLRSASAYNKHVLDTLYPALSTASEDVRISALANAAWANYGVGGVYVLTVIGKDAAGSATNVSQYSMNGAGLSAVLTNCLNAMAGGADDIFDAAGEYSIGEAIATLLKVPGRFFTDLTEYIRGVMWFPFDFPGTAGVAVRIGGYTCGYQHQITAPAQVSSCDLDVSAFPASGADDWEYLAPFASYSLELQPFGVIDLDSVDVCNASVIRCITKVDSMSGLGILRVYSIMPNHTPRLIAARTAQVGVAVPIGGSSPNYAGAITGIMSVAATAAAYSAGAAAAPALAASVGSAVMASAPSSYSAGTSGGGAGVEGVARLYIRRLNHAPLDNAEVGKPLCEFRTINTLSGYVQTRDGEVSAAATAQELSEISGYLTGGFFYE